MAGKYRGKQIEFDHLRSRNKKKFLFYMPKAIIVLCCFALLYKGNVLKDLTDSQFPQDDSFHLLILSLRKEKFNTTKMISVLSFVF